jgi:DNA-binding LytR/AlgR family response regulator
MLLAENAAFSNQLYSFPTSQEDPFSVLSNSKEDQISKEKSPPGIPLTEVTVLKSGVPLLDASRQTICSIIASVSFLLLTLMFLWVKRTQKSYLVLKKQNEDLQNQPPVNPETPKTINGFSLKTNKNPFRLKDSIFIRNHERMMKISLKDILFIKADRNYCCLHTLKKEYLVVMPLKELGEKLPSRQFLRIHRSFIINLSHIDEIGTGHVVIANKTVPLSKSSKEELLNYFHTI